MKLPQQKSRDITPMTVMIIIDSQVIKPNAWLLDNVLLDLAHIVLVISLGSYWTQLNLQNPNGFSASNSVQLCVPQITTS